MHNFFFDTTIRSIKTGNHTENRIPDKKKFPVLNFLKKIPKKNSLFETVLITANDELVALYLSGKIKYLNIYAYLLKIINLNEFKKYYNKEPKDILEIEKVMNEVKDKISKFYIRNV